MRSYIVSLMKDERNGALDKVFKALLFFLSFVYGLAVDIVDWGYRSGIRRVHRAPVPVVSVGNLTLGGTGKTPFTVYVAEHFLKKGKKPAVLTRGYGDDEHKMLKDALKDVPVYVGQDRVRNAKKAAENGADVIILDDGFQHRRLYRDMDILLLDSAFSLDEYLFPRGTLRERVSSVKRAQAIVLTKVDKLGEKERDAAVRKIEQLAPGVPVAVSRHKAVSLEDAAGKVHGLETVRGKKLCLVSGIADPGHFADMAEKFGGVIAFRIDMEDHHAYTQKDIENICSRCMAKKIDAIVTTKKDYVKIGELGIEGIKEKLFILNIAIEVTQGEEKLLAGLDSILHG